jgi:hypothetical protein
VKKERKEGRRKKESKKVRCECAVKQKRMEEDRGGEGHS